MPPARRRPSGSKRGGRPPAGPQGRAAGRAPGTRTPPPPRPGSARAKVERRSAVHLAYLTRLPRFLPFVVMLALALVAIFISGPAGGVAWFVVAAFLAWLAYFSWPALTPPARVLRIVAVGIVIAAGVITFGK
ncbi:MAG: hypothetical protein QOG53_3591 [Frankiales bacterium]|nr:hypothetical protein [Frankiales bacterium]